MRRSARIIGALGLLSCVLALRPTATSAALPTDTVVQSDDFESGFGGWTPITRGAGTATLVPGGGYGGSTGARITVPPQSGSMALLRHGLAEPAYQVAAAGRFKVLGGGCDPNAGYSAGSVPMLRLFDTDGRRVAGVYRINGNCGTNTKIYVQHSGNYWRSGANMRLGTWTSVELRVSVGERYRSTVELLIDGRVQLSTTTADNGLRPLGAVTVHNEHPDQVGDLVADDLRVATFGTAGPPANPCTQAATPPSPSVPGVPVLADGFESYGFGEWTAGHRDGDAQLVVQAEDAHRDRCAARIVVTSSSGSRAYLREGLPTGTSAVWAEGWFQVRGEGSAGSNVPFLRFFDGSSRLVDVYRSNGTGRLFLRTLTATGSTYESLGPSFALGTWHHVAVGATAAAGASTVEVRVDGAVVRRGPAPLAGSRVDAVQVGAEHFAQVMDLLADDVVITRVG